MGRGWLMWAAIQLDQGQHHAANWHFSQLLGVVCGGCGLWLELKSPRCKQASGKGYRSVSLCRERYRSEERWNPITLRKIRHFCSSKQHQSPFDEVFGKRCEKGKPCHLVETELCNILPGPVRCKHWLVNWFLWQEIPTWDQVYYRDGSTTIVGAGMRLKVWPALQLF